MDTRKYYIKGYAFNLKKIAKEFGDDAVPKAAIAAMINNLREDAYIRIALGKTEVHTSDEKNYHMVLVTNEGYDRDALEKQEIPPKYEEGIKPAKSLLTFGIWLDT